MENGAGGLLVFEGEDWMSSTCRSRDTTGSENEKAEAKLGQKDQ